MTFFYPASVARLFGSLLWPGRSTPLRRRRPHDADGCHKILPIERPGMNYLFGAAGALGAGADTGSLGFVGADGTLAPPPQPPQEVPLPQLEPQVE